MIRIVILTTFELDEYVFEAIRAGAAGLPGQGHRARRADRGHPFVADGDALLSPGVTRRLIAEFATRAKPPPQLDDARRADRP